MKKSVISVAGLQFAHEPGHREANLERAGEMIVSNPGHDIYVLPELATSGYADSAFKQLDHLAEENQGPSFEGFAALAKRQNCFICYSFPRRTESGEYRISASVVNNNGQLVLIYDKLHICQFGDCREKDYFTPGTSAAGCFEINGFRVGVAICYDIRFPEMLRKMVLKEGIVLLLHPGGWPRDAAFYTWHTFVTTRAVENSIYIMSINYAGKNNGSSIFCPPFVDNQNKPLILGTEEGIIIGEVNIDTLNEIRSAYPFLKERRPDLY